MHDQQMLWEETLLGEEKGRACKTRGGREETRKERGDAMWRKKNNNMLSHNRLCLAKARTKFQIVTAVPVAFLIQVWASVRTFAFGYIDMRLQLRCRWVPFRCLGSAARATRQSTIHGTHSATSMTASKTRSKVQEI